MPIPAHIIQAYLICPRQAWLMSRAMTADQDHDYLRIGNLIEETSFERDKKSIYIPQIGAKVDMVRKKSGKYQIIEIKKSSKTLESGKIQLQYYLYLLKKQGIDAEGVIKIPKERLSENIGLNLEEEEFIENMLTDLQNLLEKPVPPQAKRIRPCPKCAHFEFCWG